MKKSTIKLALRHETLRVLAEIDLVRAASGNPADAALVDTGGANNTCVGVQASPQVTKP